MMLLRIATILALLVTSPVAAAPLDPLYAAIEKGDTQTTVRLVESYFRDAGISTDDSLTWEFQAFDKIVHWYNQYTQVIMVSTMPTPAEVPDYWQNWSAVLTDGRWDWRGFFHDEAEAGLLANFNQYLLSAHEYGHALTYRFDPEHEVRTGFEINCREYPADRLATGLLDEMAEADPRFAALKARYRELIAVLNAAVAPEYRYELQSLDALEADCAIIHVEQGSETAMTAYASAFFVRQGLLQAADLPPLRDMYEKYLFAHWRMLRAPAAGNTGALSTLTVLPAELSWGYSENDTLLYDSIPAFGPDGTLYTVDITTDKAAGTLAIAMGIAGMPLQSVVETQPVPQEVAELPRLFVHSAAVLDADHLVIAASSGGFPEPHLVLLDLVRDGPDWSIRAADLTTAEITVATLTPGPHGQLRLYYQDFASPQLWTEAQLDLGALTISAPRSPGEFGGNPLTLTADGTLIYLDHYELLVTGADGTPRAIAGNRLQGLKDNAVAVDGELIRADAARVTDDGRLLLIDYDLANRRRAIRQVELIAK